MALTAQNANVLFVVFFLPIRISSSRCGGHRRVDCNRQNGNSLFFFQLTNQVNNLLRSSNSERRNQNRGITLRRIVYYSRQRDLRILRIM